MDSAKGQAPCLRKEVNCLSNVSDNGLPPCRFQECNQLENDGSLVAADGTGVTDVGYGRYVNALADGVFRTQRRATGT
ncbi:MAG: hypothetical protein ABFD46_05080 [Armatimonadota bacterium]